MKKLLLEWDDSLSVGIGSIDHQHRKFLSLLNDLYDAALQLKGQDEILSILRRMGEYTKEHFSYEEGLMVECDYPDYQRHLAEHISFIEFVEKTTKRLEMEDFISSIELITYLRDWLTNHIINVDKHYGGHLIACGYRN